MSAVYVIPAPLGACWVPNQPPSGAGSPLVERVFAILVAEETGKVLALSAAGEWLPVGRGRTDGKLRS